MGLHAARCYAELCPQSKVWLLDSGQIEKNPSSLAIAVCDLDATLASYRALLGDGEVDIRIGQPVVLPGSGIRLAIVRIGSSALVLSALRGTPEGLSSPLLQQLAQRSEGPYALVSRARTSDSAVGVLDLFRAHGTLIEFEAVLPA